MSLQQVRAISIGDIHKMSNTFLGKIALFSFVLLGMAAISAPSVFAATDTKTPAKTKRADTKTKKTASAKPKHKKKEVDVTQEKAQQIALKRAKGTVERSELKTEKGRDVYEFAIRPSKGKMRDIWVDQKTGKVVRNVMEKGR